MVTARFYLTIFLSVLWIITNAQEPVSRKSDTTNTITFLGFRSYKGFIIIHSRAVRPIKDSYPFGLELELSRHKTGQKQWELCNCYPRAGILFNYFNFDNPEILGDGYIFSIFIEPYFGFNRKISFSSRAIAGLAYLTNPYHKHTNPDNMSYSTHLNAYLMLNGALNYRASEKLWFNLSANYNHISNGGIKQPNKGINFPTASLGVNYALDNTVSIQEREKVPFDKTKNNKLHKDATLFGLMKSTMHEGKKHSIYGAQFRVSKQVGRINNAFAGTEWIVDNVLKQKISTHEKEDLSHHKGGFYAGHEFIMGRFLFSQALGIHYFMPYKDIDRIYHRYRLVLKVSDNIYFGGGLKAHRQIADFMDVKVGVVF